MKLPGFFNRKALIIALLSVHIVPLVFTLYTETFLNNILPALFLLAAPIMMWLAYQYAPQRWQTLAQPTPPAMYLFKIAGTFFGLCLLLGCVAYFSLFVQPVMFSDAGQAYFLKLPGSELGAYVIRLLAQAWCLAVAVALVKNQVQQNKKTGFLIERLPTQ